jgi:hypothetical protein
VLSQPDVSSSAPLVQALYFLSFLCGGVAYAVSFGLLAAGVTVTGYFYHLLPGWLAAFGMIVALAGEFSSLSLALPWANYFIPITRYLGFIWMLLAAAHLPKHTTPPRESTQERTA